MADGFVQCAGKLFKILLVQKYFMLLVEKTIIFVPSFTLCDGQIIIVGPGRFNVEKICTLTCPNPFGENFCLFFVVIPLHNPLFNIPTTTTLSSSKVKFSLNIVYKTSLLQIVFRYLTRFNFDLTR